MYMLSVPASSDLGHDRPDVGRVFLVGVRPNSFLYPVFHT